MRKRAILTTTALLALVGCGSSDGGGTSQPATAASAAATAQATFDRSIPGSVRTARLLAGLEQHGAVLGDPDAPVTIREYADLQCPFCRDFSERELPAVVREHIRTGQAKLELRVLTFLGEDSVRGAAIARRAAAEDRLFDFATVFYANQGEENTGYATKAFLRKVAGGVPGLDPERLTAGRLPVHSTAADVRRYAQGDRDGVTGTPAVFVGPSGGKLVPVESSAAAIRFAVGVQLRSAAAAGDSA